MEADGFAEMAVFGVYGPGNPVGHEVCGESHCRYWSTINLRGGEGGDSVTCYEGYEGRGIYNCSRHLVYISSPLCSVVCFPVGESFKPMFEVGGLGEVEKIRCLPVLYLNSQQICDEAEGSESAS